MRWTKFFVLAGAATLVACSKADSGSTPENGPAHVADNGQTGSPGYFCYTDDCQAQAQQWLDSVANTSVMSFVDSLCQEGSNIGSTETLPVQSCKCIADDGKFQLIAATGTAGYGSVYVNAPPAGAGGVGSTEGSVVSTEQCLAWGRGHLACKYPASEAPNCEVGVAHSCDAVCARLQRGSAEDAARTYDASIRVAECRVRGAAGDPSGGRPGVDPWSARCDQVAAINGACYATNDAGFFGPTMYDCSLSDEEILRLRDGL